MKTGRVARVCALGVAWFGVVWPGSASVAPGYEFEGGVALVATTGAIDRTLGWTFTTNAPLRVSALGYFDGGNTSPAQPADGLFLDHDVAIYDAAGNEVVRTTVGAGQSGFLNRNWRYSSIADTVLPAGQPFTVASFAPEGTYGTADPYDPIPSLTSDWIFPLPDGGFDVRLPEIEIDPALSFVETRFQLFEPGLQFPGSTSPSNFGLAGANLLFEVIPSPGSAWLLAMWGVAAVRRRR